MNKQILLKQRPKGKPETSDFEIKDYEISEDKALKLKTKYISVDPYLRGRMRDDY